MSTVCKLLTVQGCTTCTGAEEELVVQIHADGTLKRKSAWRRYKAPQTTTDDERCSTTTINNSSSSGDLNALMVSDEHSRAKQLAWRPSNEQLRVCSLFFVAAHQVGSDAIQPAAIWSAWYLPGVPNQQQYILFDPVTRSISQSVDIEPTTSPSTKIVQPPVTSFSELTKHLYLARLIGSNRKQTRVGIAALNPTSVRHHNWTKTDTFILPLPFGTNEQSTVSVIQIVSNWMIVITHNLQVAVINIAHSRMMLERVLDNKSLIGNSIDAVADSARAWAASHSTPSDISVTTLSRRELPLKSLDLFRLHRQNTLRQKYFSLWLRKTVDYPSLCVDGKVDNRVLVIPISMLSENGAPHVPSLLEMCHSLNVVIWLMISSHETDCNPHSLLRMARQMDKGNVITNVFVVDGTQPCRVYLRETESVSVALLTSEADTRVQFHGRCNAGFAKVRLQIVCTGLQQIVNWLKRLESALCTMRTWPASICIPSLRKERECTGDGQTFVTVFRPD